MDRTGASSADRATPCGGDGRHGERRRWLVLAVMCASLLLGGMDVTILHVAVPTLARELLPTATQMLWIVDAYPLTVAALLVTCGTLSDRYGRRPTLLAGFAVFGLASLGLAFASSPGQVIAGRVVLGTGTAMIMAATVAVIRVAFPDPGERAVAIGVWTASSSVGAGLGPVIGGALLERFWWGSVFLVNVPVVVVALGIGMVVIPDSRDPAPRRWDAVSAALSVAGLGGVVLALKHAGEYGLSAIPLLSGGVGALLCAWFVVRQRRLREPLVDLALFADRRFSSAVVAILVGFGCYSALLFLVTQRLQFLDGDAPLVAGVSLLPLAVANAAGAVLAPRIVGPRNTAVGIGAGLGVFCAAMVVLAVLDPGAGYLPLAGVLTAAGFGAGMMMTLASDRIVAAAPPERAGAAGAIQETSFELGAGMGIVVLGTVLGTVYRGAVPDVAGVPAGALDMARESLGAALGAAARLGETPGTELAAAARDAFTTAFRAAAGTAAALLAAAAVLALAGARAPRRRRRAPRQRP